MTATGNDPAIRTMRGARRLSALILWSVCAARRSAASWDVRGSSVVFARKAEYASARTSMSNREAIAAYLIACISTVSGAASRFSSATTNRPMLSRPRMSSRSFSTPDLDSQRSNSDVMISTSGPTMPGFASTHSCRCLLSFRPASASVIGAAARASWPSIAKTNSSLTEGTLPARPAR